MLAASSGYPTVGNQGLMMGAPTPPSHSVPQSLEQRFEQVSQQPPYTPAVTAAPQPSQLLGSLQHWLPSQYCPAQYRPVADITPAPPPPQQYSPPQPVTAPTPTVHTTSSWGGGPVTAVTEAGVTAAPSLGHMRAAASQAAEALRALGERLGRERQALLQRGGGI